MSALNHLLHDGGPGTIVCVLHEVDRRYLRTIVPLYAGSYTYVRVLRRRGPNEATVYRALYGAEIEPRGRRASVTDPGGPRRPVARPLAGRD